MAMILKTNCMLHLTLVIPAKAGTHGNFEVSSDRQSVGPGLRRDDERRTQWP